MILTIQDDSYFFFPICVYIYILFFKHRRWNNDMITDQKFDLKELAPHKGKVKLHFTPHALSSLLALCICNLYMNSSYSCKKY
ncbi:hypothetical protein HanOQP8_Chr02g0077151 [Helianthus annuus]|nr:hypothetical protein HanOQP8_Chr02g0077151 [Helianthus annuus]